MDEDLQQMPRERLIEEVRRLRDPVVPEWPEFIRGCVKYRQSLDEQAPNAPRSRKPYKG